MFEDGEISMWFVDAECALCGALVKVPTPVDEMMQMIEYIFLVFIYVLSNTIMFKIGFKYGIKTEQQARLRRLNHLKKLLNGKV